MNIVVTIALLTVVITMSKYSSNNSITNSSNNDEYSSNNSITNSSNNDEQI